MVWTVAQDAPLYPAVKVYRLCHRSVGTPEPDIEYNYSDAIKLVVVCLPVDAPELARHALGLAEQQDPLTISVAILAFTRVGNYAHQISALGERFGTVFLTNAAEQNDLLRRVVKMITTPGSADHAWCFDWADMRYLVTQGDRTRPARHGSGRASGEDAAAQAAQHALESINAYQQPIRNSLALYLVTIPKNGKGASHKEVTSVFRAKLGKYADYGSGIYVSEQLAPDEVEVDLFAFGRPGGWQPIEPIETPAVMSGAAAPEYFDIPEFLRQPPV